MKNTKQVGNNSNINSADFLPALPEVIYVDMHDIHGNESRLDLTEYEEDADMAAVRYSIEKRQHRAKHALNRKM
jgi:hypothetical protein